MTWQLKASLIGIVIALFVAMAVIIKMQHDSLARQKSMEESVVAMKQLSDDIVRNQATYVNKKDLEQFAKDNSINLTPIQDDIKKLGASIDAISNVVTTTSGFKGTNLASTSTDKRTGVQLSQVVCKDGSKLDCPDQFNYLSAQQNLKLTEPFNNQNVPWGSVGFSAWKQDPWTLEIYPRSYHVATVLAVDENGRHFAYSQFYIESQGKKTEIPIDKAEMVEQYPSPKFRFNPALYMSLDGGITMNPPLRLELIPNLQLSFFSYGKTKILPTWNFVSVGIGYETQAKAIGFLFSPVNYNLGELLPLINNLYIGPAISLDPAGNFGILGGISVGL